MVVRFSIQSVIGFTAFIAVLLALMKFSGVGLIACIVAVHAGALLGPITVGFWLILTARQIGPQLEYQNRGCAAIVMLFSQHCAVCVGLFWIVVAVVALARLVVAAVS